MYVLPLTALIVLTGVAVSGCFPRIWRVDVPVSPVEQALGSCEGKASYAEDCVRQWLIQNEVSMADIKAAIRGCEGRSVCRLTYSSESRIGPHYLTAATIFHDWQIAFDMRKKADRLADLPIKVSFVQRRSAN